MPRALGLAIAVFCLLAGPASLATAQATGEAEELLDGFDEEDASDDYGFDDDGSGDEYGFDDEAADDYGFDDEASAAESSRSAADDELDPFWKLSGDLSLGASYNYISHSSATGTHYGNLSRLRTQLDLQLDMRLPFDWKSRVEGYAFYDWVYLLKGRSDYTADVLDDYEWEVDFKEVWVQGSVDPSLDLKLGRQIVNWGRSDTVRVLDVWNPLDNREPGVVDIEDLRLPVTMARVDYYPDWIPRDAGLWALQLLVVPEFRQDRNPSVGNDFNPDPGVVDFDSDKPDRFFDDPEYVAALTGTFSGWDLSLYGARIYLNQPLLAEPLGGAVRRYALVTMAGAGGNLTFGSWLLKTEIAWFYGVEYNRVDSIAIGPGGLVVDAPVVDKNRLDWMAGVEYYGISDLSIAVELVHRHIFQYDQRMQAEFMGVPVAFAKEDTVEAAFRAGYSLLNDRLELTAVALVLGRTADLGSVVRAEASYDIIDALVLTGGIVLYQEGDQPGFDDIGDNDRFFLRLEYSF